MEVVMGEVVMGGTCGGGDGRYPVEVVMGGTCGGDGRYPVKVVVGVTLWRWWWEVPCGGGDGSTLWRW